MLALGAALLSFGLPRSLPAKPTPSPRSEDSGRSATTELGGVILFPSKLEASDWPQAEAALDRLKLTLGANAYVRWDGLWHEANWEPERPYGYGRNRRIVDLIAKRGLRSLMDLIPHPWPGSVWDGGPSTRDWGAPKPEWYPRIAQRYTEAVAAYRDALRVNGMAEGENAVQFGNEPASGNPGGNGTLPPGTWSGHALWKELNRERSFYGELQVIAPAYSVLDTPLAQTEIDTAAVPAGLDWTAPVDRRAMHFRYYHPELGTPAAYARGYVAELKRRAGVVQGLPFPQGTPTRQASRREGLWVTEGYVASGDAPEPRAETWRRVLTSIRAGVPGVRVYFAYCFYPNGSGSGPGGLDWSVPLAAQKPL